MSEPSHPTEDQYSLMRARPGHLAIAGADERAISPVEFLQKALSAVTRRRGLIHGIWNDGRGVCALGAFGKCHHGTVVPGELATQLQRYNDSMPDVTPQLRRAKVISWIEARLKELQ